MSTVWQTVKRSGRISHLLAIATAFAALCGPLRMIASTPVNEKSIAGTWSCVSLTAVENGKKSGNVKFNPGNIAYTFREDGSWQMESNLTKTHEKRELNGNFSFHGNEIILKYADGKNYGDFYLTIQDDGKTLVMTDEGSIVVTSKIDTHAATPAEEKP